MYSSDHVVLSQVSLFEKRAVDNSIAIVFANKEYVSDGYVQNVVCSMKRLQLRNWVVVAVDRKAYSILVDVYGEHAVHFDEQFWGSQKRQSLRVDYHATPDYLHFVHLKTLFSYKLLLQTSLNVAVTDGDTFWQRNPFEFVPLGLSTNNFNDCDMWFSNDLAGMPIYNGSIRLQAGVVFAKNTLRTRMLYEMWVRLERHLYDSDANTNAAKEQPALQLALLTMNHHVAQANATLPHRTRSDELRVCLLPHRLFPAGKYLFRGSVAISDTFLADNDNTTENIYIVHASVSRKDEKSILMKKLGFWPLEEHCLEDRRERKSDFHHDNKDEE
eukprot:CAMPEP_0168589774 /NCGR_PEP_ID=MMETSP0420-20121227/6197_1 /TAXON_ID=498008 /ORGANISM="Pessonella sp." /LENGTH=328 /DNA_ID=CAMNT_0008625355 /DNA_START=300 /DNA_END=1286 /DNA_ORIENTATION=+